MYAKTVSTEHVIRIVLVALIVLGIALTVGLQLVQAKPADPKCGKNPYRWNGEGKHYERPFSQYCERFTLDANESKYDGKVCSETPLRWWPCERPW